MQLTKLTIENFRGIKQLSLELDRTTVLIGENNCGKSSVLEAVHLALGRTLTRRGSPFGEYDHYLDSADAELAKVPPLVLTLTYAETQVDEWHDEVVQAMDKAVQVQAATGLQEVTFRITSKYDTTTNDLVSDWAFLDVAGNPLAGARSPMLVRELQQLNPVFLLGAVRDAGQHFGSKSSFWGPFLRNLKMDDATRKDLEEKIEDINQSVLDSHKPFDEVKSRIAQAGKLLPLGKKELVSVEAVPAKIFDMLARTQVKLASRTGVKLPITQHGAGTQSLSVMFLFEAFLNARLADAYDKHSEPLLALEEPEAHLHSSAIRSLWNILQPLKGQKIVATHSGDLLAAVPLKSIRRLARKNGVIQSFKIGATTLSDRDEKKIGYHVRAKRGQLLFARCWLFIEGESEFWLLPELAKVCGHDLDLAGVCCVEFAQCGIEALIKCAVDLGIEWHCLADGDSAGNTYVKACKKYLAAYPEADRVTQLVERDVEHALWRQGYHALYDGHVSPNRRKMITAAPGASEYPKQVIDAAIDSTSKPFLAAAVVDEAAKPGSPGVPAKVKAAIDKAVELAGRSA